MVEDDPLERLRELTEHGVFADPEFAVRILDVLDDTAVLLVDDGGVVRYANAPTELVFGWRRSDLVGYALEERLLPERFRTQHGEYRKRFFADPRPRPMGLGRQLRALHRNGSEIAVEVSLSPIVTGQGIYAVAVIRKQRVHDTATAST